ncbi:hypothetical protein A2533_03375 [Candidatus Falkowbacteria bacterium RIFOXYD2_FULL_35_9]|uniref:Glycerophosphoryl diester phosphodiesterase membrane domain-containing protein n=1 Tax=Candidatus Falkowbacteria bacterium RIFOXYC2_FULL_36_12 TaxID=1798002 RepID=A0A1F5SW16_9BACT|nr:MAG: hypothetical protein A2478_00555 [Candidatus Falkowbacteria bacterium RIFOXYC2_FULL_36_12]OGF31214.1 MAG: hypothetical protein A2300_04070 [Candidatus Falkowbacteria bacterium RIFOXYB2_FULL_35_7]OGF32996.1 MAG: hypothetical protein A2223_02055 [Candidatus Falkowbacteria bacterium RIFOXYA2_FULL_35_8]OGF47043.1 MAG: hypothetical protein A2533_03375 [Candidatus Falkowbacteria bacterium RIFOXYD2_FULL_35_9]
MKISFKPLFLDSLMLAWKNKVLWFLGIFVASSVSFVTYTKTEVGQFWSLIDEGYFVSRISALIQTLPILLLLIIIFVIVVAISLFSVVCTTGLIKAVKDRTNNLGIKIGFWGNVKFGVAKFWRMLGLNILLLVPGLFILFVMFFGVRYFDTDWLFYPLLLFLFIYGIFVVLFSYYSYAYLVLYDRGVFDSYKMGIQFLAKNFWESVVAGVIRLVLALVFYIAEFFVIILVILPFALVAFLLLIFSGWLLPFIITIVGFITLIVVSLIFRGFKVAVVYSFMLKIFWQLDK